MGKIYPVIMSGGAGTRLWPLSRHKSPKQYHAMVSAQTMFAETLLRLRDTGGMDVAAPIVICAAGHEALVQAQADSLDIPLTAIILEPMARNTAAVGAIAAEYVRRIDPKGLLLLLPADHHISDPGGFWQAISKGAPIADAGALVTLGIEATGPNTGFGYIHRGEKIAADVYKVAGFKEKPDTLTAQNYLSTGDYSWNAGIFLFNISGLIEDYNEHAADILKGAVTTLDSSETEDICLHLSPEHFSKIRSEPIDIAIMERTQRAAVVAPVRVGWDDIGSWQAISDFKHTHNAPDDICDGDVYDIDCENTYVRSDGPFVGVIGAQNLIVIATGDSVLVCDKNKTQDVKKIVMYLKDKGRTQLL